MRAAVVTTLPTAHLELAEVEDPRPGPGELLIRVAACGICGTDLHILEGRSYRPDPPFVMGHEAVGTVIEAGSPRDRSWVGRRVTMTNFVGDGTCPLCRAGDERLCANLASITGVMRTWGGFAEQMVIRTEQALEPPASMEDPVIATLVDAGATAANSVRVADVSAGCRVVVVGGGPLGYLTAEMLVASGCQVVVVQPSAARREVLERLGHQVRAALRDVTETPDVVIDAAGAPEALPWAISALAPRGTFVAAGYGPADALDLAPAARKELVIRGVRSGRREDLEAILDLVARGLVRPPPIDRWPLDGINEALAALRERRVPGKAVIDVCA